MKTKFIERKAVKNTANGNTIWDVLTEAGMFRTAPDRHVGLECQSWREGDDIEITVASGRITEGSKL